MKRIGRGILWLTLALGPLFATTPATAAIYFDEQGLKGNLGEVQVRGRFSVSAQGALIEPLDKGGDRQDGELDGEARINLEYISDSAVLFGLAGEVDTGNDDINDFERGELYAYMAADWGRLELGENDGPADTLSFHAPVVGLGQVRGDFARYIGSAALLSPYDTRDAGKITYLSPPFNGLRGGISYAPDFRINAGDPEPRRRYIQNDAFELAGQYYTLINASVIGISLAYVSAEADPQTGREDLSSLSLGGRFSRGALSFGVAYVDRGRSNLFATSEVRSEWNAGFRWDGERWSAAASMAVSQERGGDIHRYGAGLLLELTGNVYMATDVVFYQEKLPGDDKRDAMVGILELGLRF